MEEEVLYSFLKNEDDFRAEAFEGEIEHGLAEQMIEECRNSRDDDLTQAQLKVLAESVEHHVDEEEKELFPRLKRATEKETLLELGERYARLKAKIESEKGANEEANEESWKTDESHYIM